jgi:hypothetical protein
VVAVRKTHDKGGRLRFVKRVFRLCDGFTIQFNQRATTPDLNQSGSNQLKAF